MRVLLLGSSGQVGHAFKTSDAFAGERNELVVATRRECDLTDAEGLRFFLRRVRPDVIVNAAAYTAVDKAEGDRETCYAVNATAPGVMAREAAALGAKLVHYSTDYVFDGTKAGRLYGRRPDWSVQCVWRIEAGGRSKRSPRRAASS